MQAKAKLKKGDMVSILTGKDKGKRGKIIKVIPEKSRVLVEKINIIKRHTRPSSMTRQGGIIEKENPVDISNVQLVCPKCDQQTGVKIVEQDNGNRVRACRRCDEFIDKT